MRSSKPFDRDCFSGRRRFRHPRLPICSRSNIKKFGTSSCYLDDARRVLFATAASLTSFRPAVKFAVSAIIHDFERTSPCVLAKGSPLAKYKKKRARELKHDKFRDTTM